MWAKRNPENTFNFYVYNDGEWHDVSGTITIPEISVFLSAFVNDAGFLTGDDITGLQEALVSGENIKTINGQSIVGSGNLVINGGGTGLDSAFEEITISDPISKNNSGYYNLPSTIYETALTAWQTGRIPVLNVSLSSDTVTLSCPLIYRGYDFVGYFHKQGDTKTHFVCTVGSTSATINVDYEQDILQSGVNIKTINNTSLLGSGDISVAPVIDLILVNAGDTLPDYTSKCVLHFSNMPVQRIPCVHNSDLYELVCAYSSSGIISYYLFIGDTCTAIYSTSDVPSWVSDKFV